jgi:hypothetical protein
MKITNNETHKMKYNLNQLGVIINWNKLTNDQICIVLDVFDISYDSKYNFCKVLIGERIHTIPNKFIKRL